MKNIYIFTTFRDADPAYSLNRVVQDQIKMLLLKGYKPKIIVAEGFKPIDEYEKVECITIPNVAVFNEVKIDDSWKPDLDKLKEALLPILQDADVMLTHDLVYQPAALKHNVAIRSLLEEHPDIKCKFLHWVHSAMQPAVVQSFKGYTGDSYLEVVKKRFPNSLYIAFNTYQVPRVASWFGVEEDMVKVVPHPHDFMEDFNEFSRDITTKLDLLSKDVVMIYPCRLDRGKQAEFIVKIAHAVKKTGKSVGAVVMDFHSTGGDKVTYRNEMKDMAKNLGLENDVLFASELYEGRLIASMPHKTVRDLMSISNTFILPSKSETYSLVAQEAMAMKNFCILNFDFPPFRSIYGDYPMYRKFSSNINIQDGLDGDTNTTYGNESDYWYSTAQYINYVQEHSRVLAGFNYIRKTRNLKAVMENHLEPLLFANHEMKY